MINIYRNDEGDFKAFQEIDRLDNELNNNLDGLDVNNQKIKKVVDQSMLDTVDSIKKAQTGTPEEQQAFDLINDKVSKKTRLKYTNKPF